MTPPVVHILSQRSGSARAPAGVLVVSIDRSNPLLGNPHVLANHLDQAARTRVLAHFDETLAAALAANSPMAQELERLALLLLSGVSLALVCWCAPRPCHGHAYRRWLELRTGLQLRPAGEPALLAAPPREVPAQETFDF